MISKMQPYSHKDRQGSRIGIVFNGSPLFTGDAGSGESEIRRWIVENDWLETIIALPDQLFYNTGISTYIWIVTNRKERARKGKVQLVNAVDFYRKMRKNLGEKSNEIDADQIAEITRIYGEFAGGEHSKIFDNDDFGFRKITVERPLRLRFAVTPEGIEALKISRAFENLATSKKKGKEGAAETEAGLQLQTELVTCLGSMPDDTVCKSRPEFEVALDEALDTNGVRIPAPLRKAVLAALSERDETAEICLDAGGNPEPDPDLRDTESVPLKDDIHEYFKREVLPHVPDAWIDESKTKIGYEIPFTRHFFNYIPPRPLEQIEAEIRQLEGEIIKTLAVVLR
jgi:type I restriction enzyme M protein